MKKNCVPFFIALAGGAVGFGLRKWQLADGFEPDTGLAILSAPSSVALMIWSAVVVLALVLLCSCLNLPATWEKAFDAQNKPLFLTAVVLGAFLLLIGAGMEGVAYLTGGRPAFHLQTWSMSILPPLRIVLEAAGCLGALAWARRLAHRDPKAGQSLSLLILCLLFCVWLIADYQVRGVDPVVMDYVYEILAIVCILMGLYYLAGYAFQAGKPRRTAIFCLLGVYFSLVTLADSHALADLLRFGFGVLFLSAHVVLLLTAHRDGGASAVEEREGTSDE